MHMNTFYYRWNKDKDEHKGSLKERGGWLKSRKKTGKKGGHCPVWDYVLVDDECQDSWSIPCWVLPFCFYFCFVCFLTKEAPWLSVKTTLSPFPLKEKGRKEHLWAITFILHVLETAMKTKQNLTKTSSFMVPRENVCGPRRKITCDSPLVRIFRWFVTLFDFLLIEWIFSLDNLSLSDSSSSFFLYFRTEREECGNVSGLVQHRKCVCHPKYSRSIFYFADAICSSSAAQS